jgi:KDO2-lipid IV(A) lauroyltransferase
VTQTAGQEIRQTTSSLITEPAKSPIRRFAASFWMNYMFYSLRYAPWWVWLTKHVYFWFAFTYSRQIRQSTIANASRILGPQSSPTEQLDLARRTFSNVYDVICDVGFCSRLSADQLRKRVDAIEGRQHYLDTRTARKGVIVVSAHMGSFETAVAALLDIEKRIHIVFARDQKSSNFERVRAIVRKRLGVVEHALDDGWNMWLELRDALRADECVVLQIDRVLPGQKGAVFPFLHGHILLPTGAVKLALASGAPILPTFCIRRPNGHVRLFSEPAIYASEADGGAAAMETIAQTLARYVKAYPEQWLNMQPAFCEDIQEIGNAPANFPAKPSGAAPAT